MPFDEQIQEPCHMTTISRRQWIKATALATVAPALPLTTFAPAAAAAAEQADPWHGLKVGVATYTLRELPIEEAIKGVKRVGLKYVSIKNVKNHIDLSHPPELRKERAQMFRDAGLTLLSIGNVSMRSGEAETRKAFEMARDIGVPTIVCAPSLDAIPFLDEMVKQFDIRLAIHNHGPEDDLHMKDIYALGDKNTPIESGRGILDSKSILAALLKIKYQGLVGFEYEKDAKDPVPGLAESVGYIKGLLAGMT